MINDKIYTDPVELVFMKSIHNAAVRRSCKELLFDMSKCDVAVANAVKPLYAKIEEQEINASNERSEFNDKIAKLENQIAKLENKIALLLKDSKLAIKE